MLITLVPLFIFFAVGAAAGAFQAYRLIKQSRKPVPQPEPLQEWIAQPLSSWKFEPEATRAILLHTLAALALGVLALSAASNPGIGDQDLFANDTTMTALTWFVEYGSLLVMGYLLGSLLMTFPLIVFRREPAAVGITGKGIGYGSHFLPWSWFSHYTIDGSAGILRLYSVFAPDLPALTVQTPGALSADELDDMLGRLLPRTPPERKPAWYRTKTLLVPAMLLVCILTVAAGGLAARLSRELALFTLALLMSVLFYWGGQVLKRFSFGVSRTSSRTPGKSVQN